MKLIIKSDEYECDENKLKCLSFYLTIAPCKGVQDTLGFRIPRYAFLIPGTGYWIFVSGTWIPDCTLCALGLHSLD